MRIIHKVYYARGHSGVNAYRLEPPLPADPFSYVLFKYEDKERQVVTGKPYIEETTAELTVALATAVFPKTVSRDRHYGPSPQVVRPAKEIRVTAHVRALRYGGNLFLYGGLIGCNSPHSLPLEVLEWKIAFEYNQIKYESGCDSYRRIVVREIDAAPSAHDVCANGKQWPREPYLGASLEKFFFQRWLKDRSLTLDSARPFYEREVLEPYRQAIAQYQAELAECESHYDQWLERNGVLLKTTEEIWGHLQNEALPKAARAVREKAREVLEKEGHSELLE